MSYDKTFFNSILDTFENDDIKQFADKCLDSIPPYFYEVGASSSGKYHPDYALGTLGLARHTAALVRIMNYLFGLDCIKEQFTSRERDLLRLSGILHDSRKSGTQEEYQKNKWTKFDHPLQAADVAVRVWKSEGDYHKITPDELKIVYCSIRSHMGQWNTDKRAPGIELPTPKTKYEILVHVCDYLASRKDLEMKFDDLNVPKDKTENKEGAKGKNLPDINTWTIPFGRHKGKTLLEVKAENPGYIKWAKENTNSEPFHSLVMQL